MTETRNLTSQSWSSPTQIIVDGKMVLRKAWKVCSTEKHFTPYVTSMSVLHQCKQIYLVTRVH